MTIQRLRQIADHHAGLAADARCQQERHALARHAYETHEAQQRALFHEGIATDLRTLAAAFEAVGPLLTSAK